MEYNMERDINWGVLGYAGIARNCVIPAMKKASHVRLYGIASRSEEKRNAAVARFGFEKTYDNYDALLEASEIDAVYIPLPNALHYEWTIKAAEHGKHVLCEKPLALTGKACKEMAAVCEKNHVKLMEAFMYRFTDRMAKLMKILDQKVIGDIVHIYSTHRFLLKDNSDVRVNKELGGGALRDVGCYPVNIIQWIAERTGTSIASIQAQCTTFQGVDYSLCAMLRYENGMSASLSCGFDGQTFLVTEINGTKGSLLIRDSFIDSGTPIMVALDTGEKYEVPVEQRECYQLEIEEFTSAIREGREPVYTLREAESNNLLIEEILKIAMREENSEVGRKQNV